MRVIIVGPRATGKTHKARELLAVWARPEVRLYEAPAAIPPAGGAWVCETQSLDSLPQSVVDSADSILVWEPRTPHTFREGAAPRR